MEEEDACAERIVLVTSSETTSSVFSTLAAVPEPVSTRRASRRAQKVDCGRQGNRTSRSGSRAVVWRPRGVGKAAGLVDAGRD